jgi:hypothetical protein
MAIEAHKAGHPMEAKGHKDGDTWHRVVGGPSWNFADYDYRAIPEPREFCLKIDGRTIRFREVIE